MFRTLSAFNFLKWQILDASKLKECADDNSKFSNSGETLWDKEKLLLTSNFSFSHSIFKACTSDTLKPGLVL